MVDVHVRSCLDDELVRMDAENWHKLLVVCAVGGEDVILRTRNATWEAMFVIRGGQNIKVDVREADRHRELPVAVVMSCEEIRSEMLSEEAEKSRSAQDKEKE